MVQRCYEAAPGGEALGSCSDMLVTLRRQSQFIALCLAALLYWCMVSQPEVLSEAGSDELFYAAMAALVVAFCGLCFFVLKLGTRGSTIYWRGEGGAKQVQWIGLMVGVALAIQLCVVAIFVLSGRMTEVSAQTTSLLVMTLVPAAFLLSGFVKWPRRLGAPSRLRLLLTSVGAICLAAAYTYNALSAVEPKMLSIGGLSVMLAGLVVAAGAEEIIFRVLLLTALLDLGVSRFQAVFLSGVVFAAGHAPLALAQPIILADWAMLHYAVGIYMVVFLAQVMAGLVFGVLWLRTGSIILVTLTHALLNVGWALANQY